MTEFKCFESWKYELCFALKSAPGDTFVLPPQE